MQSVPKFTATPGLERSVELALANSYDLAVLKISEQRAEIQARVASDSARPDVSAVGTLDVSGLGAGAGEAFAQVGRLEAIIGYVGVSAALPLNNRSSEAAAERAQIDVSRLQDDREVIERQLRAQVKLQHTNLQTATQRLELARQTAALAEQNVKTVEDRFELGRATSLEVVQALQRLRESRQRMTSALIDAQIASITLRALTGQLLTDVANPR
jgi:outer membrane protein TolC